MKEHPILFSGPMVKAILEGRKTQTRRVVKGDPNGKIPFTDELPCPYGLTGDRLWVRETFEFERWDDEPKPPTDGRPLRHHKPDPMNEWDNEYWLWPHYKATDPEPELCYEDDENDDGEPKCKWRPSIHMPRWASRITLEITCLRIERLQNITAMDCISEGIARSIAETVFIRADEEKTAFRNLWDSINAKRGYGWAANPWVWIIEFQKVDL